MDVGEERPEGVEVPLRERVELMVVALGAAGRLAQPRRADRADAVRQHALLVVLGLGPAFLGGQQQAVETRAHLGLDIGVRQQVARHLLQGETVEALVLVEAPDDVIAVGPDIARRVAVVADGVGVPHHVEPALGHALAVVRAGQQPFHEPGVGVGRAIGDEGIHFFRRGRQTEEVEVKAAGERAAVGLADGSKTLRTQPGLDQRVDGRVHGRRGGFRRQVIGPMVLVGGALRDPAAQQFLLLLGEGLVRFRRRHDLVRVGQEEPLHEFARLRLAWHDRLLGQSVGADIETQLGLTVAGVVAVAGETVVGEDRPNVPVEFHRLRDRAQGGAETEADEGGAGAHGVTPRLPFPAGLPSKKPAPAYFLK